MFWIILIIGVGWLVYHLGFNQKEDEKSSWLDSRYDDNDVPPTRRYAKYAAGAAAGLEAFSEMSDEEEDDDEDGDGSFEIDESLSWDGSENLDMGSFSGSGDDFGGGDFDDGDFGGGDE